MVTIVAAAVKVKDRLYTGRSHSEIFEIMPLADTKDDDFDPGFLDSDGNFVRYVDGYDYGISSSDDIPARKKESA